MTNLDKIVLEAKETELIEATTTANKFVSPVRLWQWFKNIILNRNNTWGGNNTFNKNVVIKGESQTTGSVLSLLNSDSSKLVANFQNNGNSTFLNVITKGLTVSDASDIWSYWTRTGGATLLNNITSSKAQIGTSTNHELYFITNNVDRIKILSDGRVGIGTAMAPQGVLDVESTTIGSLPAPRMTEAQRLAIVQYRDGMFAYQTDAGTFGQGLYIYISSLGWKKVTV